MAPKQPVNKVSKRFWYPADDEKTPVARKTGAKKTATLKKSITPGTVLILLAGRFRGKRVVFLKQLSSGLLLVTGPYKINGVPLKRVNQSYTIATSTKVDISGVNVKKIEDDFFKREKAPKAKKTEDNFFAQSAEQKKELSEEKKSEQKSVDAPLLKTLKADKLVAKYLGARFSLTKNMRPHQLSF